VLGEASAFAVLLTRNGLYDDEPSHNMWHGMSSSLDKALERFDRLSEKQLSEIARRLMRGSVQIQRKAKTRGMQKA
jgi:hypothetical protein